MLEAISESDRKAIFRNSPMVVGFLSTMLQDLQLTENDDSVEEDRESRDVGTIYDCPESTLNAVIHECETFLATLKESAHDRWWRLEHIFQDKYLAEPAGSDLYLERAGHGAGFRDRKCWHENKRVNALIGERLSRAVPSRGSIYAYIGDDGKAYIFGAEN